MKKVLLLFVMCITFGCNDKRPTLSEGEQNAIRYAQEHANVSAVIDKTDTLLCADVEILSDSIYDVMFDNFEKGRISTQQFRDYQEKAGRTLLDIYLSWGIREELKQDVRKNKDYDPYWRIVYTVDGTRIMMDVDGVTPVTTEREFRDKMNRLKFNITENGRYCDF